LNKLIFKHLNQKCPDEHDKMMKYFNEKRVLEF